MSDWLRDAIALLVFGSACAGFGRLLCVRLAMPDLRLAIPLGFSFVAFSFSMLAAFQVLNEVAVVLVLAIGCGALLPQLQSARYQEGTALTLALIGVWSIAYLVIPTAINATDDANAYLGFAVQAAHDGFLQPEPFSERRLFSQDTPALLGAALRTVFGAGSEALLEPVIGMLLLALAVVWQPQVSTARKLMAIQCVFVSGLLGSHILGNTAPAYTVALLAFALLVLLNEAKLDRAVLWCLALLLPAAVSLRATVVPFLAMGTIVLLVRHRQELFAMRPAAFVGPLLVLMLQFAPHAYNSFASTGTPLFPAWAVASHGTVLGYLTPVSRQLSPAVHLENLVRDGAIILGGCLAVIVLAHGRRTLLGLKETRSSLVAVVLATLVIIVLTSGMGATRYGAPLVLAFIVAGICSEVAVPSRLPKITTAAACMLFPLFVTISWSVAGKLPDPFPSMYERREVSRLRLLGELPAQREVVELAATLPPRSTVLAESNSFLLYDLPLRVLINDQPGVIGPMPGWQAAARSDMAAYLRAAGIDFVIMNGRCETPVRAPADPTHRPWISQWNGVRETYYKEPLCAASIRRREASLHTVFDIRPQDELDSSPRAVALTRSGTSRGAILERGGASISQGAQR